MLRGLEPSKNKNFDVSALLEMAKTFASGFLNERVLPKLKELLLVDTAKTTDIDNVSVSLVFSKYENGIAHAVKFLDLEKHLLKNSENKSLTCK